MNITIAKINRKEGESKLKKDKNGNPLKFEQLGIAPLESILIDINGDSFERQDRWLSGFGKAGVTDNWTEGDVVKINLIRVQGKKRDGTASEFINFRLPEGVDPMVKKFTMADGDDVSIDPNDDF